MDNHGLSEDMSTVIEKLMADEKFGELLASIKESFSANEEPNEAASADTSGKSDSAETVQSDTASPISSIPQLSPEMLSKLPDIMSMLSGSSDGKKQDSRMADRKRLLYALKPFLSENRRNAVDSIVNIAGIADLFGI